MSRLRWRTPASTFCSGSNGLATFSCRAVCGINCMSPIAPVRETALGLKFDSTLMTARTKLETCCEVLTSAAAERAARTLADGTDFQQCAVGLQYISPLVRIAETAERLDGAAGTSSLT